MFGDYPSLFGRDFAIGYFIPVAASFVALIAVFFGIDPESAVWIDLDSGLLAEVGIGLLVVWLLSVVLMAINRNIIRFMEGYGERNPFRLIKWFHSRQLERFKKLSDEEAELTEQYRILAVEAESDESQLEKRNEVGKRLVQVQLKLHRDFPDQGQFLLPTTFGNRIRAFEVYPRVLYGLDSIGGWERLIVLVPQENREPVGQTKAVVDFWVNLHGLSLILSFVFLIAAFIRLRVSPYEFLLATAVGAAVSLAALRCAANAVVEWGSSVKALFDLYRVELAASLGFEIPPNDKEERLMWQEVTKVFLFGSTRALERLNRFRPAEAAEDEEAKSAPNTFELVHRFKM